MGVDKGLLREGKRRFPALFMGLAWGLGMAHPVGAAEQPATPDHDFSISLVCGSQEYDPELDRLFAYAEDHAGAEVSVQVMLDTDSCSCQGTAEEAVAEVMHEFSAICELNPEWWAFDKVSHCVGSLLLGGAGIGTFCFPSSDKLPAARGYAGSRTQGRERIAGSFVLNYEFLLGAPHVALFVPEEE